MMFYPSEQDPLPALRLSGCLVISMMIVAACLLPIMLVDLMHRALTNLHLTPATALLVLLGMLLGSVVNLPIHRMPLESEVLVPVFKPLAGWNLFPRYQRLRQELVISINFGGCVIPVLLAVWLSRFLIAGGMTVVTVAVIGVAINTVLCYRMARLIPGLGIALPVFLPALIALSTTWIGLAAEADQPYRAPVAFVIGITGPLLGADLLHWKDFRKIGVGAMSIGGAGTWDGIVLSGLLAALLA